MTNEIYFFDTYAILEIINGSDAYNPYVEAGIILTKLNLFELYYAIHRMFSKEIAKQYVQQYKQFVTDFDEEDIEIAADLKSSNRKLSMTDCIGYATAMRNNVKFLTGDMQFKGMANVKFVK